MATITGTTNDDILIGTDGDDVFTNFLGGSDLIVDNGGFDTLILNRSIADGVWTEDDFAETVTFGDGASVTLFGSDIGNDGWGEVIDLFILNDFIYRNGTEASELVDYSAQGHATGFDGNGGNDTFIGSAFGDEIEGGIGNDVLNGGGGDDVYYIDDSDGSDTIDGGAGYDTLVYMGSMTEDEVDLEINYFTGAFEYGYAEQWSQAVNIERVITDWGVMQFGSAGADTLAGADGNVVIPYAGGEDVFTVDTADRLHGFGGNDSLVGGAGSDMLDGGVGNDTLVGGGGDDMYVVDSVGDVLNDSGGSDMVVSLLASYTLGNGFEALVLGDGAQAGTGNGVGNLLIGNAGDNTLNGGAGADYMNGGAGDDTYYVDNAFDQVVDYIWDDFDTIIASVSISLDTVSGESTPNIDKVVLQGSADLTITDTEYWDNELWMVGNAGMNTLMGNMGTDILDGGAGVDSLMGGEGSDIYLVDNVGDVTKEFAGEGTDVVHASVTWTLARNTEHLFLSGTAGNGNGNTLANLIVGNAQGNNLRGNQGADTLYGGEGNDTIQGGGGADILSGGAGADRFLFNATLGGANVDRIQSFTVGSDRVQLDDLVFTTLTAGTLAAAQFRYGTNAADADDRIIYDSATGSLYYDADGNGAGFKAKFATLDDKALITAADIQIV